MSSSPMNIETALAKALGRMPTAEERERLLRLREAFDIRDNDALWALVGVNEFYNSLLRQYPDKCAVAARQAMRECWASGTVSRPPNGQSTLPAPAPARGSQSPMSAESLREQYWVIFGCMAMAACLVSSGLALFVGPTLAGNYPCWVPRSTASSIAVSLLGAPLGWLVVVVSLVPSGYALCWGWRRGRDAALPRRSRAAGWSALAAISCIAVVWLVLLGQLAAARQ